jgi:hypothetical protein
LWQLCNSQVATYLSFVTAAQAAKARRAVAISKKLSQKSPRSPDITALMPNTSAANIHVIRW